jgi:hypothetical protein
VTTLAAGAVIGSILVGAALLFVIAFASVPSDAFEWAARLVDPAFRLRDHVWLRLSLIFGPPFILMLVGAWIYGSRRSADKAPCAHAVPPSHRHPGAPPPDYSWLATFLWRKLR